MKLVGNDSSRPMNFDSDQLEELDKLIDNLRKEIVFPSSRAHGKPAPRVKREQAQTGKSSDV